MSISLKAIKQKLVDNAPVVAFLGITSAVLISIPVLYARHADKNAQTYQENMERRSTAYENFLADALVIEESRVTPTE